MRVYKQTFVDESGPVLSLIFYQDGAAAGNILVTDPSKLMELFYYSFYEFGPLRLCLCPFWVTLCAVRSRVAKLVLGGLSHITEVLLAECQTLENSICILGPSGQRLHMFVRMGCFLSDEAAAQHIFRFKGHSMVEPRRMKARRCSRDIL